MRSPRISGRRRRPTSRLRSRARPSAAGVTVPAPSTLYGTSSTGLSASGSQFWTQNSAGILDTRNCWTSSGLRCPPEILDGPAKPTWQSVSRESIGGIGAAGAVNVIYGTAGGLASTGSQILASEQYWKPGLG